MTWPWAPSNLVPLLRERGFRPDRRLGQNFLLDRNLLDSIVRDAEVGSGDGVVEIGTGPGNLTDRLSAAAGRVWSFEVDPSILQIARELLGDRPHVTLIRGDGARFAERIDARGRTIKVVANLPYSRTSELLEAFLATEVELERIEVMLQRDAWERLAGGPGTPGYGPLGVALHAGCDFRIVRRVGPSVFVPRPRVESVVVEIRRRSGVTGRGLASSLAGLRRLFRQRRRRLDGVWRRLTGEDVGERGEERVGQAAPERLMELASRLR